MRGIIVRVRLRHFMVFTDIEMKPGRNVNVIIAPNGCGKSSLISGIMLGLCGKPHDIGRAAHAESVQQLESKMMEQEAIIANVELRNAFSLHCLHVETQLVHAYLEILASVLNTLVAVQAQGHTELADVWRLIQPTVLKCLPEKK